MGIRITIENCLVAVQTECIFKIHKLPLARNYVTLKTRQVTMASLELIGLLAHGMMVTSMEKCRN